MDNKFLNMEDNNSNYMEYEQQISDVQKDVIRKEDNISDLSSNNVIETDNISLETKDKEHYIKTNESIKVIQDGNSPEKSDNESNKEYNLDSIELKDNNVSEIKEEIIKETTEKIMNTEENLKVKSIIESNSFKDNILKTTNDEIESKEKILESKNNKENIVKRPYEEIKTNETNNNTVQESKNDKMTDAVKISSENEKPIKEIEKKKDASSTIVQETKADMVKPKEVKKSVEDIKKNDIINNSEIQMTNKDNVVNAVKSSIIMENNSTKNNSDKKNSIKKYYSLISSFVFKFKNNNPFLFKVLVGSLFLVIIFPKLIFLFIFSIVGFVLGLMYIVPARDIESLNSIKANSLVEMKRAQKINAKIDEIDQEHKERKEVIYPGDFTPEMKTALDNFTKDFIINYIDKWWYKLNKSGQKDFTDNLSHVLNKTYSTVNLYARNVSITSLIVPIFNHLIEQMQLYREFEASGLSPDVYLRKHSYSKLTKFSSRDSEIKILRDLGALIANQVLSPEEKNCNTVFSFLQEIMATTVLLPIVEKLSDPYFINNLIYTKLGDNSKPKKPQKQQFIKRNFIKKKTSQNSINSTNSVNSINSVNSTNSVDDNQSINTVVQNNPSNDASFDKVNDISLSPNDQESEVSLSYSDSNVQKITFEEGIKDDKMFSDFNIFMKNQGLDELLYLYIKIEQFKSCLANKDYNVEIAKNYGNNIINNYIFTDRQIVSNNLINPKVLEQYKVHIDGSTLKSNFFDELQDELCITFNIKFWPVFLKFYNQVNDDNSTIDCEIEDEQVHLSTLPPNVKNIDDYSLDDHAICNKEDMAINAFINRIPPVHKKTNVINRYHLFKHRRRLSEGDLLTLKTFGIDYISKMQNVYGDEFVIKDNKRVDRHLDHIIALTQDRIDQYENNILSKKKEVDSLDRTIEHVMDNFNKSSNKDEELLEITVKKITAKKMEYQMEMEELCQVKASMINKIKELKNHQIFKAKYRIIIIDPLQDVGPEIDKFITENYQFQIETYNLVNLNEKFTHMKTYNELYNFHLMLKLRYKSIPDFPTFEYIIYKNRKNRDQLISSKELPREKWESSFSDLYKIRISDIIQELENYFNNLANIPSIGENRIFINFITNQPIITPLQGPASASLATQRTVPETVSERRRKSDNVRKLNGSGSSLSTMMSFIKTSKSNKKNKSPTKSPTKSSTFSFSRLNEKINDKINDKILSKAVNKNTSSLLRNITSNSSSSGRSRFSSKFDSFKNSSANNIQNNVQNSTIINNVQNGTNIYNAQNDTNINNVQDDTNNKRNSAIKSSLLSKSSSNNGKSQSGFDSTVKLSDQESIISETDADSIKSVKSTEENINMSPEAVDMILECIICLVEEIFQLNNPDQWMRQKAFQVVKQVALKSFSSKINNILCAFLGKVFSEESFTKYVNLLDKNLFHKFDGMNEKEIEKEKAKKKEIPYEEKERVKYNAKKILLTTNKIPYHYISKVVGTRNTQNGMNRLFDMFQVPEFNRHLMCVVLQSVVICVFDNDEIEI